jgi:hypothetical protein
VKSHDHEDGPPSNYFLKNTNPIVVFIVPLRLPLNRAALQNFSDLAARYVASDHLIARMVSEADPLRVKNDRPNPPLGVFNS